MAELGHDVALRIAVHPVPLVQFCDDRAVQQATGRVHGNVRRLVHGQQVRVFVQHGEGDVAFALVDFPVALGLGELDEDFFSAPHLAGWAGAPIPPLIVGAGLSSGVTTISVPKVKPPSKERSIMIDEFENWVQATYRVPSEPTAGIGNWTLG